MIYTDQTFWCYLCNESQFLVNQVKEMLTKNYYDFDTKKKKTVIYYQNVNKIEIDNFIYETIRFPAGLIKYITDKLPIEVDRKQRVSRTFKEDDVRNYANIVHGFNEKFEVRDYQIDAAMSSLNRFASLIYSSVGSGKGQPISLKIPTPDGFKSFGDLKVGDSVFGRNGKSTKIIGVFPQGLKDIYRFKFSSGQETTCDISHLWTFCNRNGKNKITISTDELLKRNDLHKNFVSGHGCEHSYYCLSNDPVQYESKVYEIDPYVLGVIIGDGDCTAGVVNIASPDTKKFIRDKVSERLDKEYSIKMEWHRTCPHFNIIQVNKKGKDGFIKKVKQLGLDCKSTDKFIPKEYLEGSINQRIDLLHGLMDTNGACISRTKRSSISYSTTSLQLAKDVQQLVFSLGGICRFYKPDTRKQNSGYTLLIQFDSICPFSLNYKKERWTPYKEKVYLKEIEYVGKEKTVCIKVSNSDELYITSDYVLTHNTSVMSLVCKILSNDRILITNGNNFILQQIYDRLLSFDITDVSWNPSKEPDYSKRIVLINTKSSDERLNKQDINYLNFLKKVNCWIIDEVQHFQSLTSFEPWFYMDENNLQHVIGYSGSPFRNYEHPYNNEDDFVLISLLGEPSFTYTMKDSIGDENVAQPYSYFINYPNKEAWVPPHLKDNYFVQYRMNIIHNKARNRAGIELLKYLDKYGVKTLASINNIKPGQNLMKTLKEEGVKSQFICGDNTIHEWVKNKRGTLKLETRTNASTNDIKQAFEDGYNIIFGSSVLDEGVDIEEFQAVVLFSAGKTPIAGIQRLGRCSRKKKEGKNISFVIDFKDINGNYIFQSHYEQRKKMMRDSGVINIEKVQDFCKMIQELNKE